MLFSKKIINDEICKPQKRFKHEWQNYFIICKLRQLSEGMSMKLPCSPITNNNNKICKQMSNYHGENTMNFCYVYIPTIEFYDGLYQKLLQAQISEIIR